METETAIELFRAIPIAIGGAIAIAGGLVAQWMTHHFTKERERQNILLEKAERLVDVIYAHKDWLDQLRSHLMFGTEKSKEPDPMHQVWMLRELYFPSLDQESFALNTAAKAIISYVYDQGIERVRDLSQYTKSYDPAPLLKLWSDYLTASNNLIRAVSQKLSTKVRS